MQMSAFEIKINGERIVTAGVGRQWEEKSGIVSVLIDCVRRDTDESDGEEQEAITLSVRGLTKDSGRVNNLHWLTQRLQLADEICIKIVEPQNIDEPEKQEQDSEFVEQQRRRYFESLKIRYGENSEE
jgi:hypothetical protein